MSSAGPPLSEALLASSDDHPAHAPASRDDASSDHALNDHALNDHALNDHALNDHALNDHASSDHASSDHAASDHAGREDASSDQERGTHPTGAVRLTTIVQTHHSFVWRSLRRLGALPGDVDDAAQNVFLITARKLANIAPAQERAFLFATAVRVASNARRAQSRVRHQGVDTLDEHESDAQSPESQSADRELLDRLLSPLPMELRGPFILFELEQMTTQEIATLLEIPVGTAASRLRRARELVNEAIVRFHARGQRERGDAR